VIRVLGVIPARGGSKGVPRKNIRLVAGEPLIAYSIRAAQASCLLEDFLTTTDDEEIAEIAGGCGSRVMRRSPELGRDETPIVPVLQDALRRAEEEAGYPYGAVVLLQPTAPIRSGEDVDSVIQMLEESPDIDTVISVIRADDVHPARMYRLDEGGSMEPLWPEWEVGQRQDLPAVYCRNGALYAFRREVLMERNAVMGERKKAYVMGHESSVNIDNEMDLLLAEAVLRRWKEGRS
jgi:CMP-N-acetylneuraminic acid synthetase